MTASLHVRVADATDIRFEGIDRLPGPSRRWLDHVFGRLEPVTTPERFAPDILVRFEDGIRRHGRWLGNSPLGAENGGIWLSDRRGRAARFRPTIPWIVDVDAGIAPAILNAWILRPAVRAAVRVEGSVLAAASGVAFEDYGILVAGPRIARRTAVDGLLSAGGRLVGHPWTVLGPDAAMSAWMAAIGGQRRRSGAPARVLRRMAVWDRLQRALHRSALIRARTEMAAEPVPASVLAAGRVHIDTVLMTESRPDPVHVVAASTRLGREAETLIEAAWGYSYPRAVPASPFGTADEERSLIRNALSGVRVSSTDGLQADRLRRAVRV